MVYAHLLNPHWVNYGSFEPDALGLNLGCRLTSKKHIKNLRLMGQADGSVINIGLETTNSHFQYNGHRELLWAFSLSMEADYQLNNRFHISAGPSFSYTVPYYSVLTELIFSLFLVVDYRFRYIKKK